jgi:hypothetical protein
VASSLDNVMGFNKNESGSYSFQSVGDEYDPSDGYEDIDVEPGDEYVIFHSKGIVKGGNDQDEIREFWDNADEELEEWDDYLILGAELQVSQLINYSDTQSMDDTLFHALGKDQFGQPQMIHGSAQDVLESLQATPHLSFMLYEEVDRK